MCLHSFAPLLYSRLEAVVAKHVGGVMGALASAGPDHTAFLGRVAGAWADHCEAPPPPFGTWPQQANGSSEPGEARRGGDAL